LVVNERDDANCSEAVLKNRRTRCQMLPVLAKFALLMSVN
jgi:hypothetical protein